jgi:polar amino acid transport system permease protein
VEHQLDFAALLQAHALFSGALVTVGLAAFASVVGICLSVGGAALGRSGIKAATQVVAGYVELIRNTPFLVQMFFIFFGLPSLGLHLNAMQAAALAMTINLSAYSIEIVRAGIEAVPQGQREAGMALGLRPVVVFGKIVLPQALGSMWPALVSQVVIILLESAVVSQIAVRDLTYARRDPIAHLPAVRNVSDHHGDLSDSRSGSASRAAADGTPDVRGWGAMMQFTLWDMLSNLLLAARWTLGLTLPALACGGAAGLALLALRVGP